MPQKNSELTLKKDLGLWSCTSYVVGAIIGVGIFISPKSLLEGAGGSFGIAILLWILCGFLSYTGALCFAELGVRVKTSGGHYVYVKESFGVRIGFTYLWAQSILILPMGLSIAALATAEYILRPVFLDCPEWIPVEGKRFIATATLWLVSFVNCWGARWGAVVQNIVTFAKIAALLVIIVAGIVTMSEGHLENFDDAFVAKGLTASGIGLAIYSGLYSYMGWDSLNFGYEEIKRAEKIVPIAITVGLGIAMLIYLLANIAYHSVLSNQEILSGIAVAVVFGERKLGYMKWFVLPCIAFSAAGILNVILFKCSRVMYTAGRCQLLPEFLSMIHTEKKTPIPALFLTVLISNIASFLAFWPRSKCSICSEGYCTPYWYCLGLRGLIYAGQWVCLWGGTLISSMIIWFNDISTIIGSYSQINNIGYMLAIAGLFRLRKLPKYKDNNELRVPTIFPVAFLVLGFLLFCMSMISSPMMTFIAIGIMLVGLPIYYVFHERPIRYKWTVFIEGLFGLLFSSWMLFPQRFGQCNLRPSSDKLAHFCRTFLLCEYSKKETTY